MKGVKTMETILLAASFVAIWGFLTTFFAIIFEHKWLVGWLNV